MSHQNNDIQITYAHKPKDDKVLVRARVGGRLMQGMKDDAVNK